MKIRRASLRGEIFLPPPDAPTAGDADRIDEVDDDDDDDDELEAAGELSESVPRSDFF